MGSPEWAERFSTVEARIESAEQVDEHVAAWARAFSKQDAETLLQSHGVPATAVYSPAEILRSSQLAHRGAFEPLPTGSFATRTIFCYDHLTSRSPRHHRMSLRK